MRWWQAYAVPVGLTVLVLLMSAVFLVAHSRYPGLPSLPDETGGWRNWADQSHYIEAARAWATLDLTPARHWYPPGYPMLGAPFLRITPQDRFLLPDLACLIASLLSCAALGRRLFPGDRFASLYGAAAFLVASVGTLAGLKSWLVPWSTTPSAALTFVAFVAVLRLAERPGIGRALLAGASVGGIVWFRPGDAVPVALAAAIALTPRLLALPIRQAAGLAGAAVLGAAVASALAVATIRATSGFGPGTYYALSAGLGFDIRLLPLRWVSLVIDGRPLFDGVGTERLEPGLHRGLIEAFPWIIPGIGGLAACWFGRGERRVHILLATWLIAQLALVLCYRDLHVLGFWLYENYHYFKVTQPIFLLFAGVLAVRLLDRSTRWRAAGTAFAAIVLAFGWRASLVARPAQLPPATADTVAIPGLGSIDDAAIVQGTGPWNGFYYGAQVLTVDGQRFHNVFDFRIYPRRADFIVVPLRHLLPYPGVLTVTAGIVLATGDSASGARQAITFGLPCAFDLAGSTVCGRLGTPLIPSR